jgi:hypothetical protein
MPILTTKAFWNVDALRTSKVECVDLGKQKLKLTDVLYVIESLKDKIKAIDKQMGTQRLVRWEDMVRVALVEPVWENQL